MYDNFSILLIGPFPEPTNGCSHANKTLLHGLLKRNQRVEVINTSSKKNSENQGSKFSFTKTFFFLKTYIYLYKIIYSKLIYITPGQTYFGILKYAPFIALCIIFNKPYILHIHGNHLGNEFNTLNKFRKRIFKWLISNAVAGIVLSKSLRKNFDDLLPESSVFVIENFVSKEIVNQYPAHHKSSKNLNILYFSNLMREKGIMEFLESLLILKKYNVKFHAKIAGSIEENIAVEINKKLLDLKGYVTYCGTAHGQVKLDLLSWGNVFVLPTYYPMEGQPISLLEGMASGQIIIATRHAGIPDIMNEKNGWLIPTKSILDISNTLRELSLDLPSAIDKFSNFNATYAAERFDEDKFVNGILDIFKKLLNSV